MRISVKIDSKDAKAQLRRWGGELREKARKAAARGLAQGADGLKQEVRSHVASRMAVQKKSFPNSFRVKVMNKKKDRPPVLYVGSRVPWGGIHEQGGVISGRMLIPLYGRTAGREKFKKQINALRRGGNAYFIKTAKGNIVLMSKNRKAYDLVLAGFKRRYRHAEGIKRLKRDVDTAGPSRPSIPIAVLVPRVKIKKRLEVGRIVAGRVPRLAAAVEKQLRAID